VYLKCLLVIEGKPKQTFSGIHNLHSLYTKLGPQVQNRIKDLWDQQVWTQGNRAFFEYVQTNVSNEPIPRNFTTALQLGANTFVELRYVYEKQRNINNIIVDLPPILRRVIVEIQPNWKT
jgi:hypothetical protein